MIGLGASGCQARYASRASTGHSTSTSSRVPATGAPLSTVSTVSSTRRCVARSPRGPEGMPEGELDTHDAWGQQAFRDVGHHRDQHRRDAGVFQTAGEHRDVLAAVGAVGRDDHAVDALFVQHRHDLGRGRVAPLVEPGGLVAHHRDVLLRGGTDDAIGDELVERPKGNRDFVVVEEVGGVHVEVGHGELPLLRVARNGSPRRVAPRGFPSLAVGVERHLRRARQPTGRQQCDLCIRESRGELAPHDIGLAHERLRRGEERLKAPGQVAETVDSHGPSIRRSIAPVLVTARARALDSPTPAARPNT